MLQLQLCFTCVCSTWMMLASYTECSSVSMSVSVGSGQTWHSDWHNLHSPVLAKRECILQSELYVVPGAGTSWVLPRVSLSPCRVDYTLYPGLAQVEYYHVCLCHLAEWTIHCTRGWHKLSTTTCHCLLVIVSTFHINGKFYEHCSISPVSIMFYLRWLLTFFVTNSCTFIHLVTFWW